MWARWLRARANFSTYLKSPVVKVDGTLVLAHVIVGSPKVAKTCALEPPVSAAAMELERFCVSVDRLLELTQRT